MIVISGVPWGGEVFPKRILSFSVPRGSRVFLSSFPSLGLIFQSDNLHLTLHPQGISLRFTFLTGDCFFFHTHIPDPKLICPVTSWTVSLGRVTGFSNSTCKNWAPVKAPVVQWLGLPAFTAEGLGSIQELRSHKLHGGAKKKKKKIELPLENLYFSRIPYFRG